MSSKCEFCDIIQGKVKEVVTRASNSFIAMPARNPIVPGHIIIIPKKHFGTLLDIPLNLAEEMLKFTKDLASDMLDKKLGDGFNIVMNNFSPAGQIVNHAHIHIIPRKDGDGIRIVSRS